MLHELLAGMGGDVGFGWMECGGKGFTQCVVVDLPVCMCFDRSNQPDVTRGIGKGRIWKDFFWGGSFSFFLIWGSLSEL